MKNLNSNDRFRRQVLDLILIILAYTTLQGSDVQEVNKILILFILVFLWYFTSQKTELYDDFRTNRYINEVLTLLPNIGIQGFAFFSLNLMTHVSHHPYRDTLLYMLMLGFPLLLTKYLYKQYKIYKWSKGKDTRNILIVGNGAYARELHGIINENKHFGYKLVGIVNDTEPTYVKENYFGKITETEKVIQENEVDEMIICTSESSHHTLKNLLDVSDRHAVKVRIVPEYFKFNSSRFKMDMFGKLPMVTVREEPLEQYQKSLLKRVMDILFTLGVFVFIFSWLFPIIALCIKLDSRGPVFYLQDRWGKGGKLFKCFKFRTMQHNVTTVRNDGKFYQTVANDPRITRVGKFLRKTNLDELPQFINVLIGDMSVVGPRPHAHRHSIETMEKIPHYLLRHLVKPGITGWAQANGFRGETSNDFLMEKRVEFDIWYIENWSVWLDIKIILMTAYNMVKGEEMAY